jgi:hypothetical protein
MHRIWIGLDPKMVMSLSGTAVSIIVLVIHLFAFKVVNYPGSVAQKYPQYYAPAAK